MVCLYLNNQRFYGWMDDASVFNASNWSKTYPPCYSDSSWKWWYRGKNKCCWNFSLSEIGPDFACTSTTGSPMDKWMLQADSAHQTGLKTILYTVLILVESGGTMRKTKAGGIFHPWKLGMFLLLPQQPALLWTNGCYRQIQRIKLVEKQYSTLFWLQVVDALQGGEGSMDKWMSWPYHQVLLLNWSSFSYW